MMERQKGAQLVALIKIQKELKQANREKKNVIGPVPERRKLLEILPNGSRNVKLSIINEKGSSRKEGIKKHLIMMLCMEIERVREERDGSQRNKQNQ